MTTELSKLRNELSSISTKQLLGELQAALRISIDHVLRAAAIIQELDSRGVDLSELHLQMLDYMRKIAGGKLLAEVVVEYQNRPLLLAKYARLPIDVQQSLLEAPEVKLVCIEGDNLQTKIVAIMNLSRDESHQIFSGSHVRSPPEQIEWLSQRGKFAASESQESNRLIRLKDALIDREKQTVEIAGKIFSMSDLLEILAKLSE